MTDVQHDVGTADLIDLRQTPAVLDALYRYADPDSYCALRVFPHERGQPPPWSADVKAGDLSTLIEAIARGARYAATSTAPAVFCPTTGCTFRHPGTAKTRDIAEGLALAVELDDGDTAAVLARLEALIGAPTLVVLSGSLWADPETGELHPKRHAYWRLSEAARGESDLTLLYDARRNAALLTGADPTGAALAHCYRWPGSLNRKDPAHPARCTVDRINPDAEIHLIDAAERLAEAIEGTGLTGNGGRKSSGVRKSNGAYQGPRELQADPGLVAGAMATIPNPDARYNEWVRMAYAVAGATGGAGYDILINWSAKSSKHDAGETKALWSRVLAARPTHIGAGSIFHEAKQHGWIDPRRKKPDAPEEHCSDAELEDREPLMSRRKPGNGAAAPEPEKGREEQFRAPEPEGETEQFGPPTEAEFIADLAAMDELAFKRIAKPKAALLGVSEKDLIKRVNQARREAKAKAKANADTAPPKERLTRTARQAEIERLANLKENDPFEYDEQRDTAAARIGCRLDTLDEAVDRVIEDRAAVRGRNNPPSPSGPVADTPEVTALVADFNAKYFVLNEAGKTVIYAPKRDHQLHRDYFERITFDDFQRLYLNKSVRTGMSEKTGGPIYSQAAQVWLRHRNRRQFIGGMVFDPSGREQDDSVLNLWQGFGVKPQPGPCEKFKDHLLRVICCNDTVLYKYVLDWMADVVQHPDKRGEIALVLWGKEGCGKGIFGYAMKHLLGQHGLAISNAKHLVGHFNAHLRDTVLLFADEAFYAGDRAHSGILKAIITERDLIIEAKYQNAAPSRNYLHIIMASNERWVVPASLDSRRFVVFAVPDTRIGDHTYFGAIEHELERGGYEALLAELLARDISGVNLRSIPVTDALITQRKLSLDTTEAWWLDCLERGYVFRSELGLEAHFHEWLDPISMELLYQSYERYCRAHHERHPLSREMLGKWLRATAGCKHTQPAHSMVGEHITDTITTGSNYSSRVAEPVWKDRAPGYRVSDLPLAREAFLKVTGLTVEWPEDKLAP